MKGAVDTKSKELGCSATLETPGYSKSLRIISGVVGVPYSYLED